MLENGSFENGWSDVGDQQQKPEDWALTWKQPGEAMLSAGAFPNDDPPVIDTVGATPECVHMLAAQLPPNEQPGGVNALILDGETVYKVFRNRFSATLSQVVNVPDGARVRFSVPVQVHHHNDGSYGACAARVFLDGATSPWATFGAGLTDHEWEILSVEAIAGNNSFVGVDLEGRAEADVTFFIDAITLEIIELPDAECRGKPRVQYERTYWLMPQSATVEQLQEVSALAYPTRGTVGFSADDAGIGDLDTRIINVVWCSPNDWDINDLAFFFDTFYPGCEMQHVYLYGDPPDPPEFDPENFTPRGTKAAFHGSMGDQGQINIYNAGYAQGVVPPTGKLVAAWGASQEMSDLGGGYIVGRVIDTPELGPLEWFDSNQAPIPQAEARMAALLPIMQQYPAVDYWEIINEQNPPHPEDHANMALFFMRAMQIAEDNGKKLGCFSYSVGTPKAGFNGEPDYWENIAATGVFERMAQGGHILCLHEYGQVPGDLGHVLCRYRHVYNNYILPRGLDIPLIITEYGVIREHTHDYDFVFAQMLAYDAQVRQDPYCVGFQMYIGPIGDPDYYNAYTAIQQPFYVDYMIGQKDVSNEQ